MDRFVSHKSTSLIPPRPQIATTSRKRDASANRQYATQDSSSDESTEVKLGILASLDPTASPECLLDILISCNGSVEDASNALVDRTNGPLSPRHAKRRKPSGLQSSLPFTSMNDGAVGRSTKIVKPLTRKGKTLHLFTPADIAAHTPCSIIHNFLSTAEATALTKELLAEAPTFTRATFKLFDNVVQSPHTACFYVDSLEEREQQKSEYLYNGSYLSDVREILPKMRMVSSKVEDAVNQEISIRIRDHYPDGRKLKYQSPKTWMPNAAFVNCYNGGKESVGYHSDQLTYLGPRAIIGSLSLGVAREFRIRRIVGREAEGDGDGDGDIRNMQAENRSRADEEGQIAIHLPHNSLLVMHAEMQEEWKHSIHPSATVEPHPIAGNKRINITYRWYRDSFHPRHTPRCDCGMATVLKCVQKKKENRGRYVWMCQNGAVPDQQKRSCAYFQWASFTDDGEPLWKF
jgi:alkylated DNA repair dioxygenase AlkB